ncbi:hypothetical protein [Orenia marismortui]|uniref:hypothetical protein n=1 Tax=Orenia marismortui TaxID=46469 RepID=UPI00036C856A|nr:hypothetical protein [Orenia marismortui]
MKRIEIEGEICLIESVQVIKEVIFYIGRVSIVGLATMLLGSPFWVALGISGWSLLMFGCMELLISGAEEVE